MASKKTLAARLFNLSKISKQALTNCRISSTLTTTRISQTSAKPNIAPDSGDNGTFRRFLHKRAILQPKILPIGGESLMEKLKTIDIAKDRIRLDGLSPPPSFETEKAERLSVKDASKVLKAVQMEVVKEKLRQIEKPWIPYSEFVRVCEEAVSDPNQGLQFAKLLDESGNVIVLGNVVFLRPEQITKAVEGLIHVPEANSNDPRRKEFEELERQKTEIDKKADSQVRRELWCGLGCLVVQTTALMRLTFWELTWDVMEPICFYVTSIYFLGGYAFFLRTSKEPSFVGFYRSRFTAKQKKLFKLHNFDVERYNELRNVFHP
ncbi:calcium uniporter protein 2, mitochondrial-like [Mangifera indica]|uniref:calcium uniporter protein 2, mitochondrial-like n=1 Tax=Mangifera indica TaxID=29780 RepID=UPI001CFC17E5|nr:calcium uniporter protein 2, mitochondrial-like [Mangifera indica]